MKFFSSVFGSKPAAVSPMPSSALSEQVLVCVHDTVSQAFYPPFVAANDVAAVRELVKAASSPGPIQENPGDFRFVVVATINKDTGVVTPVPHRALTVPIPLRGAMRAS